MLNRSLANALIKRGYDVVLANDIAMTEKDDDQHLAEATKRNRVLVTLDKPFAGRTTKLSDHAGLVCWTQADQDTGAMVRALTEFAEQYTSEQAAGQVFWLK